MQKGHIPTFWAHSHTIPEGVELVVQPRVKPSFCPETGIPQWVFGWDSPRAQATQIANFQPTHASLKMAKSSQVGSHRGPIEG